MKGSINPENLIAQLLFTRSTISFTEKRERLPLEKETGLAEINHVNLLTIEFSPSPGSYDPPSDFNLNSISKKKGSGFGAGREVYAKQFALTSGINIDPHQPGPGAYS